MIQPIAIEIYTDGSSKGNPGNGGFAYIIRMNGVIYKFAQGELTTTNNRMELSAVIAALNAIKSIDIDSKLEYIITIYSDSKYVTEAINKNWLFSWVRRGFFNIKNSDLWSQFFLLVAPLMLQTNVKMDFRWIKGHSGIKYNDMVDGLAKSACGKQGVIMNYYFEEPLNEKC
jgi:ribonuclease HI